MLFPKAGTSCCKKNFGLIFAALYFYIYELKKCVSDFKILFQNGDINIFVLRGAFISRYVQLKNVSCEIRDTLGKVLRENSINGRDWSSSKLFIVQNYAGIANGNVSLMCIFLVSLSSRCASVLSL